MKSKKILLFVLLLSFVSCSNSSKEAEEILSDTSTVSDIDETAKLENEYIEGNLLEPGTEKLVERVENDLVVESSTLDVTEKQYAVGSNETLMMVSFKLYGDYSRWKEIAEINASILNGSTQLKEGMILKYLSNGEDFSWNPQGNPYLIKSGDTLGTISNSVYETPKRWKEIWNNNRPLIKDPDKIFAGFTIYYIPDEQESKELAFNTFK